MLNTKKLSLIGLTLVTVAMTACGSPASKTADTNHSKAAIESAQSNGRVISTGTFSGRSDHVTTGQVTLNKTAAGYQLVFASNFSLDGAPDPVVAVGNGETYLVANKIGALKSKAGGQVFDLPQSFTPSQFSEVYVWCEKFSAPLGVATLSTI